MAKLSIRGAATAVLLLILAACGGAALEPVPLAVDRASCARCGMLVSDLRSAAQAVSAGEDPRFYDDPGCLAGGTEAASDVSATYVATEQGWVRAAEAYYARPENARTPMGYGFVAFAGEREAQGRDSEGRARRWDEVVARVRTESHRHAAN